VKVSAKTILCGAAIIGTLSVTRAIHEPAGAEAASQATGPLITRLVTRDLEIAISSGIRGPVYTVTDRAGKTLVTGVSLERLRADHPAIYERLAPALADSNDAAHPVPWAGIDSD
jgi:hypothetical protein